MLAERYYFLFVLAFVYIVFASIQDLKKREVANWLNFSLIAFAFAYRGFYSVVFKDWNFFLFGLIGFVVFFCLANVFYYSKIFAGGDAKLLMGLGIIFPFESTFGLVYFGLVFIFALFGIGAIYSMIYSGFIAYINKKKFVFEIKQLWIKNRMYVFGVAIVSLIVLFLIPGYFGLAVYIMILFLIGMYVYLKAVEKCMIRLTAPGKLTEGDWLDKDVKINGTWIRKSVHGLSLEEIARIRKSGKKVFIKEGIPFVPAFFLAFVFMVFFFSIGLDLKLVSSLLQSF